MSLCFVVCAAMGQGRPNGIPDFLPDSVLNRMDNALPDTIVLQYFKLSDITQLYDFKDSTLDNFFHHYDPVKRKGIDHLNLGNAGTSARSMTYESNPYVGFSAGRNQYDVYNYTLDDFRFYENNVPFSNVSFTPVSGQQNFVVCTDFARSFSDGTSLSLNYRRIRQVGFYTNQLTKTTNFGTSLRFKGFNDKYTGFLSFLSNVNEEGNSGGITTDTLFNQQFFNTRSNIPVFTSDANTRHQQKLYSSINYYQLNNARKGETQILLRYDLNLDFRYYKFVDDATDMAEDSLLYGTFLEEDRGIRFYDRINRLGNAAYGYISDGDRLNIRAGIVYDRYSVNAQEVKNVFDNVFLDFKGDVPITKSIAIKTEGKLGLLDGAGDFLAKGRLDFELGKWITLEGGLSFYRYTPQRTHRVLILNGQDHWRNELTKPVGTDIFASFSIPKLNIKGSFGQSIVNNAIYFDTLASVQQYEDVFTATKLKLSNEIKFWKLGLENYLLLQAFNDNIYNLPTVSSKHNLYLQGYLFNRVLLSRLGAEVRLTPSYTGMAYSSVIGDFHQSNEEIEFYPMTDVYFTGQIQKFRVFLRFENINNLINDGVAFQIQDYPQFDFKFRFGFSWLLLN